MGDQITTTEAARITRHASRRTFLKWAKRFCPELLHRLPGRREWLVDKQRLVDFLSHCETY